MVSKLNLITVSTVASAILMFSGCAAVTGHGGSLKKFDKELVANNCNFEEIDKKIEDNDDVILWGIQGGSMARNCNDYNKSTSLFDKAELKYKTDVDTDSVVGNVGESLGSVLVNNNVNDYEGNVYEKVMVNTYKGLNFMSMGDYNNARVEFHRALDRQRRAKEFFQKDIKKKQEELKSNPNNKAATNEKTQKAVYAKYDDIFKGFEAYPDFVNPFTTYSSGLFFLLDGESRKARDMFKEALAMDPNNKQIKQDYDLANQIASSTTEINKNYAWVIYENGNGMVNDEIRIDLPLFLVSKNVMYTGMALPKLKERNYSYNHIDVNGVKTAEIANMDRIIKTEFKKKLPGIVTEAVLNTIVKTVAQKQLKDKGGLVGGLFGAIYQGLTNKADVRNWTALPKSFQVARVELNGEPLVIKDDNGEVITTKKLASNSILYVRSSQRGHNIIHTIHPN
ncbi:MAG: hypothetical protein U9Q04_04400 [Campylobacterota bacterium]|nr:hypothetical protein [Campylobacterota bacterium]